MNLKKLPRLDPSWLVLLLLAIFATWPLLTRPGLPTFTDGEQHVYRTIEIMEAWRAGVPYLRWAPDLFYGLGYPVFNYYSPLTYYLAAAYGWFLGGPVAGIKFVMVLAAGLGAAGMYYFLRDHWGALPGLTGATAFALSPFIVYLDPLSRGDAPESLALAIAPWLFWSFTRLLRRPSSGRFGLSALLLAALVLAHNLMAVLFFGWLLLWLVWNVVTGSAQHQQSAPGPKEPEAASRSTLGRALSMAWREHRGWLLPVALTLALGVGLSAFLWLPAIGERHAVQLNDAINKGQLDYRRGFVPPEVLLRPATGALPDWQLGLPQWLIACLGVGFFFLPRPGVRRSPAVFFAGSGAALVFLMLPSAEPLWTALPFMAFLQFSWRLLGPASFALSAMAGYVAAWLASGPGVLGSALPGSRPGVWRLGTVLAGITIIACVGAAQPLIDPLPWADFSNASLSRLLKSGLDWWPGTTATNEFLPATVKWVPPAQESLLQSYETGLVDKVDRGALPAGAEVAVARHDPQQDRLQVNSPAPFTLRIFTFYFPGWRAYVDGRPASIAPSDPEGWITVSVPGGPHDVWLRFEDTWIRQLGWGLSGLSLAGLVIAGLAMRASPRPAASPSIGPNLPWGQTLALCLVFAIGIGVRYVGDQSSWWRLKPEKVQLPNAQQMLWAQLESNLALIGFDLPQTSARPGQSVPVTLYWEAVAPVTRNLRVFVHFIGADGKLWGLSDHLRPGGFEMPPTSRWPVFRYKMDAHQAMLDPGTPPGAYTIRVGLWDGFTGERMRVLDANGQVTDQDGIVLMRSFQVEP